MTYSIIYPLHSAQFYCNALPTSPFPSLFFPHFCILLRSRLSVVLVYSPRYFYPGLLPLISLHMLPLLPPHSLHTFLPSSTISSRYSSSDTTSALLGRVGGRGARSLVEKTWTQVPATAVLLAAAHAAV